MLDRPTRIAFYLPQFHPIVENDGWYGTGFTEWRNVVQAKPLFSGHYQPHIPADLGFYDLRVPEVREAQARMAKRHGIDAFCYYHYWFRGQRPLRRVLDDLLNHGMPNMPFCIAWANENWSRHWDASRNEVLLKQEYDSADDEAHGRYLQSLLEHPLYLRVNGRPVLFIYRIQAMPNPAATLAMWRDMWREADIGEVEIIKFESHGDHLDPTLYGADSSAQFMPHGVPADQMRIRPLGCHRDNIVHDYEQVVDWHLSQEPVEWRRHECVFPSWDNTPRRGEGRSHVFHGSTPERYGQWLAEVYRRAPRDGLVLINAWNEWAESAHLEPDLEHGSAYLEATARAFGVDPGSDVPVAPVPDGAVPFKQRDHFADLYLDAVEALTRLQLRYSRLQGSIDRQIQLAEADIVQTRADALTLKRDNDRLKSDNARLQQQLARVKEAS
ncbi:MAG: glycoside hydrolase family 99-like domain-containing protein [Solirubrobacterales bacterium]|nr:glycoside hydrolase family 99-like domain-containing protein [Solirubrobacterales bacterium]